MDRNNSFALTGITEALHFKFPDQMYFKPFKHFNYFQQLLPNIQNLYTSLYKIFFKCSLLIKYSTNNMIVFT